LTDYRFDHQDQNATSSGVVMLRHFDSYPINKAMDNVTRALQGAGRSLRLTSPNPRVGCVLTTPDNRVIGEGHTQQAGGPHAEIMALRDAQARGEATQGATAWVTLEPCSHHGRTGPCCDALIAAGIRKVVGSVADPNPLVAGEGFARLRAAGIEVVVGPGAKESRELNLGFFSRMIRQVPWVRMKVAASLDGKTALDNGVSQWITAPLRKIRWPCLASTRLCLVDRHRHGSR
jgi:diaminohydroxyphosphoribosylaminopyrimidine deaminase/5-amino-6-(5-phosphoribosylamino)uracil reductase